MLLANVGHHALHGPLYLADKKALVASAPASSPSLSSGPTSLRLTCLLRLHESVKAKQVAVNCSLWALQGDRCERAATFPPRRDFLDPQGGRVVQVCVWSVGSLWPGLFFLWPTKSAGRRHRITCWIKNLIRTQVPACRLSRGQGFLKALLEPVCEPVGRLGLQTDGNNRLPADYFLDAQTPEIDIKSCSDPRACCGN